MDIPSSNRGGIRPQLAEWREPTLTTQAEMANISFSALASANDSQCDDDGNRSTILVPGQALRVGLGIADQLAGLDSLCALVGGAFLAYSLPVAT